MCDYATKDFVSSLASSRARGRLEAIMLQILPVILFSNSQAIAHYSHKKSLFFINQFFINSIKPANNEDAHVRISNFISYSLLILLVILLIGLPPLVPIFRDLFRKYLPTQRFRLCERAARS